MKRVRGRYYILLEVLIAMAIVSLAIAPLVKPVYEMVKEEHKYLKVLENDRDANRIFATDLEALYNNSIPWNLIEDGSWVQIEKGLDRRIRKVKSKPQSLEEPEKYHVIELHYRKKDWEERFHVFVERAL